VGKRSVRERFGTNSGWDLPDGRRLDIGEAVTSAGPGSGFAMLPWALMRYGRALRLRPGELWLLGVMLAHVWSFDGEAFLSARKLELCAVTDRVTLWRYIRTLEGLGYVRCVSDGQGRDRRKRYDLRGVYCALAIATAYDPTTPWAQRHGRLTRDEAMRLTGLDGQAFDIDFGAIDRLAARTSAPEPDEEDQEDEPEQVAV